MLEDTGERFQLEGAIVYFHVIKSPVTGEPVIHIDVEHPDLDGIIPQKESSYVGGKKGGLFVGLRPGQAKRAEEYLQGRI